MLDYIQSLEGFLGAMACGLFGAKLLPGPMLAHFQLDSWE